MKVIDNIISKVIIDIDYVHDGGVIGFKIPQVTSFNSIKDIISILKSVICMVHF